MTAWRRLNLDCLDAAIKGLGEPEPDADLDANLAFLADLREQRAALLAVENEVERIAARQMSGRTYTNPAAGLAAERSRSYADDWDARRVVWAITQPLCLNEDTGEVLMLEEHLATLVDRFLSVTGVSYFRSTALRELGLDPEEYRTRELRRTTVKVTRATEAGPA